MICPRCGSENVNVQVVTETQRKTRWCLGCFFSWIAFLFPKQKSVTHTEGVCQDCGNRFRPGYSLYASRSHNAPSYTNTPSYTNSNQIPANKSISSPTIAALPEGRSTADELEKYADLLSKGAITQEEFDLLKVKLLGIQPKSPEAIQPKEQSVVVMPELPQKQIEKKWIAVISEKLKIFGEKIKLVVFPKVKSLWTKFSKGRSAIVEPESVAEIESADLSPALSELWENADSVASNLGAPNAVCQYDTPFKPEIIYMPDKHFSAQDTEQSIVNDSGRYDFTRFSEYELRTINGAIQSVYKYPTHLRAIGLANESEGILYKARSVLFEMVIQKYADSLQPLDMLAVAFAYQSQGASSRQKAIEYFERAMPYLSVKDFSSFINFAPLGLYNKFSRLYEKEHEWDKAIYYLQLAEKYCDMDAPYYKTHLQELEAKKEANKPLRRRKLKEEDLILHEQLKSAAQYFLSQFDF